MRPKKELEIRPTKGRSVTKHSNKTKVFAFSWTRHAKGCWNWTIGLGWRSYHFWIRDWDNLPKPKPHFEPDPFTE